MQSRAADGSWDVPFAPSTQRGFTEGCAAQYTWMTPQNYAQLVKLLNGPSNAESRLDDFFTPMAPIGWSPGVPHYWLGNEPTMETPYVYNWLGVPWKTQRLVRTIMLSTHDTPDGYVGNDDVGAMSALYVFSALGLNPSIPGIGGFTITSPLFTTSDIYLAHGSVIHIRAKNKGTDPVYIQSLILSGKPYSRSWVTMDQLTRPGGSYLDFSLGDVPNRMWGSPPNDLPPSFSP